MNDSRNGRLLYCVVTDDYGETARSSTITLRYYIPEGYDGPTIVGIDTDNAKADPGQTASVTCWPRAASEAKRTVTSCSA